MTWAEHPHKNQIDKGGYIFGHKNAKFDGDRAGCASSLLRHVPPSPHRSARDMLANLPAIAFLLDTELISASHSSDIDEKKRLRREVT